MMLRKHSLMLVMAGLFALAPISSAVAQDDGAYFGGLYSTTTTGLTTAAVAGGVVLTVVLASGGSKQASLETYMRHNSVAIQHDLYMGGGETARDLAQFFEIRDEDFSAFAQILFDQRQELVGFADPDRIDALSVYQFSEVIVRAMMENPRLAVHLASLG